MNKEMSLLKQALTFLYLTAETSSGTNSLENTVTCLKEHIKHIIMDDEAANLLIKTAYSDAAEALGFGRLDDISEFEYVIAKEQVENAILDKINL